eukprot:scaffold7215_cov40-Phaeocystis_antarctica.AAC.1
MGCPSRHFWSRGPSAGAASSLGSKVEPQRRQFSRLKTTCGPVCGYRARPFGGPGTGALPPVWGRHVFPTATMPLDLSKGYAKADTLITEWANAIGEHFQDDELGPLLGRALTSKGADEVTSIMQEHTGLGVYLVELEKLAAYTEFVSPTHGVRFAHAHRVRFITHAVFVSPKLRATRHYCLNYCPRAEIGRSYRRRV